MTVINTNQTAYLVMKLICSSYVIYLGVMVIRYSSGKAEVKANRYSFKSGVLISLLNPKTLIFFGALFPLFIQSEDSFAIQAVVLTLELLLITFLIHVSISFTTEKVSTILENNIVLINRLTGVLFMGIGISGFIFS